MGKFRYTFVFWAYVCYHGWLLTMSRDSGPLTAYVWFTVSGPLACLANCLPSLRGHSHMSNLPRFTLHKVTQGGGFLLSKNVRTICKVVFKSMK